MLNAEQITTLISTISKGNLTTKLTALSNPAIFPTRFACWYGTKGLRNQETLGDTIQGWFEDAGVADVAQEKWLGYDHGAYWGTESFPADYGYSDVVNVIATIPGVLYPDKVIVICGHHDSLNNAGLQYPDFELPSFGADDNGTSVCALVELARAIIESGYIPEKTIKFISFGSEEQGCIGSHLHVDNIDYEPELVIALDMLGYNMIANPNWSVKMHTYTTDIGAAFARIMYRIFEDNTSLKATGGVYWGDEDSSSSDSYPFFEAGFPAVYLEEYPNPPLPHDPTRNPNYHEQLAPASHDDITQIDFDYYTEIVKGVLAAIAEIAGLDDEIVRGQTLSDRYADGYTMGSSSDPAKPINAEDLVMVQYPNEEFARVARAKDLLSGVNATITLQGDKEQKPMLEINRGIITIVSR